MKRILRGIGIVILIGIVFYTFYFLWKKSQKPPEIFQTEQAIITNIVRKTVATGSVKPRKEIEIKPQISGIVDKIYIEAGDMIEKNDLIAKVKIIPNVISLNNAESRVKKAKINLDKAKKDYEKQKELFNKNVVSETGYLQYEAEYKQAKEELEAAENNLQLVKEGITKSAGTATNTLVRSTIRGMALDVPVEEGNSVIETNNFNAGTTIAIVANMDDMIFEGKIDESEVGKLKIGMPLILTIGAIEDQAFDAVLEYIAPKGVEENGAIQFEIRASLKLSKDYFVRAGYSATADIVLDRRDSVLAVNEKLIQFESDKPYVEVETQPQVFEKRYIKTGLSDGIFVEVLDGVNGDDKIKVWAATVNVEGN